MRFIDRLFGKSEPPQGLEGFVGQLQQGINNHLTAQRQQELERRNAEAVSRAAELSIQAELAQKQRAIKETKAAMMAEAKQVLDEFQVEDSLRHIQGMVWKGKGMIRFVEPELYLRRPGAYYSIDQKLPLEAVDAEIQRGERLGGLELVHQYQLPYLDTTSVDPTGNFGGPFERWRYISRESETSLSVVVLRPSGSGKDERALNIRSRCDTGEYSYKNYSRGVVHILDVTIPVASRDSKALLDQSLTRDTESRLTNQLLPSQLEEGARSVLAEVKRRPSWGRWVSIRHDL